MTNDGVFHVKIESSSEEERNNVAAFQGRRSMCPAVSLVSIATRVPCMFGGGRGLARDGHLGFGRQWTRRIACSPGSLAKALPALVDAETGLFTIPDTRSDLVGFFRVHQAITKAIDTALTRSQLSLTPREAAALEHPAILFGPRWRAAESGVSMTHDGKNVTLSPAYGHPSFIDGIVPVDGAAGQYYMMPSRRRCPASIQSCWRKRQARGPGRRNRTYLGSQGRTVGSPWIVPSKAREFSW